MTTSPTANSPEHSYGLEPENLTDYRAIIRSVIVYGKTVLRHEISGLLRQPAKDFDYGAFDHRGLLVAEFEPDNITYLIRPDVLEFTHDRCQAYAVTDIAFLTEPQKTDTLLALMAEKNPAVFNYLYQYELPGIIALVMRNSGNEESGKDIFQEAVLRVTEKVCTGTLSLKCTFSTFLYSVARNLWFNELR
ncbi:MAG: hypothetical protein EOL88_15270, partial [Bacteroidia bacterium]|nr:hypothetical protein [Bacteroidia bacterium]